MAISRLLEGIYYNNEGVAVTVMSSDEVSKEIRIVFKKGQVMESHMAPFPITVMTIQGSIEFGYDSETTTLNTGDFIKLGASVMHDLIAKEDSVVLLTLSFKDTISRVESVQTH